MVTRALTEGRHIVDPALLRPERGPTLESFLWVLTYRERSLEVAVRDGVIGDEFGALARMSTRSIEEEGRLTELKGELMDSVMARTPTETFDVKPGTTS